MNSPQADSIICEATFLKKSQNRKIFSNPLTPYFTITYLFSVFSVSSVANIFFNPNAHLRPIMGRLYILMLSEIKFNKNKKIRETCPPLCLAESVLIRGLIFFKSLL
jgi:hypothetical protein